jgi:mono/diheme cytochrome c family protein
MKKKLLSLAIALPVLALFIAATGADWDIPAEYKNKQNPIKGQQIEKGKQLYMRHCKMCHGTDGTAVGMGKAKGSANLFAPTVQNRTDGEILYMSIVGSPQTGMPNYEKKIRDENDQWAVVNYIRTLKQ